MRIIVWRQQGGNWHFGWIKFCIGLEKYRQKHVIEDLMFSTEVKLILFLWKKLDTKKQ